jgi:hypothetical protein
MYEQLVVDETCVLAPDGVEPIVLGPGEVCEFAPVEQGTDSAEAGDDCLEETTGGGTDGADETMGDTTGMMFGSVLSHPQPPPSILTTASNGNSGYRPTLSTYRPARKNVGTTSSAWA